MSEHHCPIIDGQPHQSRLLLLTGIETAYVIVDKGRESNKIAALVRSKGATTVMPPKSNRKNVWEYGRELYRKRNLIERAFNKLKHCRRIATRYDRRSVYFLSSTLPGLLSHLGLAIVDSS